MSKSINYKGSGGRMGLKISDIPLNDDSDNDEDLDPYMEQMQAQQERAGANASFGNGQNQPDNGLLHH